VCCRRAEDLVNGMRSPPPGVSDWAEAITLFLLAGGKFFREWVPQIK